MKRAIYGRMKIGRCIKQEPGTSESTMNDYRFLGCSENILSFADSKCSEERNVTSELLNWKNQQVAIRI